MGGAQRSCASRTIWQSTAWQSPRALLRWLLWDHGFQLFHVLDVHLHAARHHDVAGLLVGLAGAEPLRLDRGRGIPRRTGSSALAVRGRLDGIARVEVAGDLGVRGDRHAGYTADR